MHYILPTFDNLYVFRNFLAFNYKGLKEQQMFIIFVRDNSSRTIQWNAYACCKNVPYLLYGIIPMHA